MCRVKANNIAELVGVLREDMKMTRDEIADYVGVEKYVISYWHRGKGYASERNYDKVADMVLRLSGQNIKYPRQAMDILREQDERR